MRSIAKSLGIGAQHSIAFRIAEKGLTNEWKDSLRIDMKAARRGRKDGMEISTNE
jgi:hypothetical protein